MAAAGAQGLCFPRAACPHGRLGPVPTRAAGPGACPTARSAALPGGSQCLVKEPVWRVGGRQVYPVASLNTANHRRGRSLQVAPGRRPPAPAQVLSLLRPPARHLRARLYTW